MTLIHLLGEAYTGHLSPWKLEDKITLVVSVACIFYNFFVSQRMAT